MAELSELKLDKAGDTDADAGVPGFIDEPAPLGKRLLVGLSIGILVGFAYLGWRARAPVAPPPAAAAPATETPASSTQPVTDPTPAVSLPALASSDAFVRESLGSLSTHPRLAQWLAFDDLARRFTAALDNFSGGRSPAKHLPMLVPTGPFRAQSSGGRLYVDPASYQRYDTLGDVIGSLDGHATAGAYRTLKPLFAAAYRELGVPVDVDETVARAIRLVLSTPVIDDRIELRQGNVLYEYADRALEERSAAEKHLLRLGPRNLRLVQAKVREVARALGVSEAGT